ncbi:FAD-dependent monooxygenase [Solicola sp. PLA-1-18]|uniref:FAD-dependent monooxygenase n=1 Tax=Solicola sp. PLA-1-18 TaxID=3380532 RepID=UPI003B7C29CE
MSADRTPSRGSILVTGGSIAGPAAAFWLSRAGWQVTVLERWDGPRPGGQNIDVRGLARDVLDEMGLTDAVLGANTGEQGTRFVDEDGETISEFPVTEGAGDGPTAELEVLRGELARVVVEACPDDVTWWFGDQVIDLDQPGDRVSVTLASGDVHDFDLVVVAEGAGSRTRGLLLDGDDAPTLKRLGMYTAYGTIPRTPEDDDWWRWMSVTGSRSLSLRPDNLGTTRATLSFMSDPVDFVGLDRDGQLAVLRERFGDLGWEAPRVLDAIEGSDDLYVEDLTQVMSPTWSVGRVCLLGDAAWCVTPIAGGGTSLALTGAYVLAAELARLEPGEHPSSALDAYEAWMRPLVDEIQTLPPGVPRVANPESRLGVALFRTGTRLAASGPVQALAGRFGGGGQGTDRTLPEMPAGVRA